MPRREAPRDEKNATSKIGREAPRDDHREKTFFQRFFHIFKHFLNRSFFEPLKIGREAPRDDRKDALKSVARRLATIQNKKI